MASSQVCVCVCATTQIECQVGVCVGVGSPCLLSIFASHTIHTQAQCLR